VSLFTFQDLKPVLLGNLGESSNEDPALHDRFGQSIAIADFDDDGDTEIAVGAPGADTRAGRVLVYSRTTPTSWPTHKQTLFARQPEFGDRFGWTMASGAFTAQHYGTKPVGPKSPKDLVMELAVGAPFAKAGVGG